MTKFFIIFLIFFDFSANKYHISEFNVLLELQKSYFWTFLKHQSCNPNPKKCGYYLIPSSRIVHIPKPQLPQFSWNFPAVFHNFSEASNINSLGGGGLTFIFSLPSNPHFPKNLLCRGSSSTMWSSGATGSGCWAWRSRGWTPCGTPPAGGLLPAVGVACF